jgi:hypothetical protein
MVSDVVILPEGGRAARVMGLFYFLTAGASTEISIASVQVMSRRSPIFTFFNASLSSTRELYFQPFGPLKVIDGIFGSIY